MTSLRYGIVGGGFIASFQLKALSQVRGVTVEGIVSRSPALALAREGRNLGLGPCNVYGSIAEMAPQVDVIAIFAPNHTRIEVVEAIRDAVAAGAKLKGLICEKPLGRNVAEARRLLALAGEMDLPTAYFENQLHMKSLKAARAQLTPVMETMGPPVLVRSSEEHAGPHRGWFWDPTRQGGGVMSDMGCHCLAVGWYGLTPPGKPVDFLEPVSVSADLALLKWGRPRFKAELLKRFGVDYDKTPAEDFATGMVTFKNPETDERLKAQFTVSWMYDKQGLRLLCDGLGPGYAFELNSLKSPMEIFVGDAAATEVADGETAIEKVQSTRGLLPVLPNEPDLYGYPDENADAAEAFLTGRRPLLDWEYGLKITRLTMAAYFSAERDAVVDLTDPEVLDHLETYIPAIQRGAWGK